MEEKILLVKSSTNVGKLAGSVVHAVRTSEDVKIRGVGAGAVNQAIKAIILANKSLEKEGSKLAIIPNFIDSKNSIEMLTVIELLIHNIKV